MSMNAGLTINLGVDSSALVKRMEITTKQFAYASVNAMNMTALRIQQAERARVLDEFTVRKRDFIMREAAIIRFANVSHARPFAEIAVGDKPRLLLSIFESGGGRRPFTPGAKAVAVPLTEGPARPSFQSEIAPQFTFAGMHLTAFYKGKRQQRARAHGKKTDLGLFGRNGGTVFLPDEVGMRKGALDLLGPDHTQWKGRNRTFLLKRGDKMPFGGVFQRFGPKKDDIMPIYSFRKGISLPARLGFITTGKAQANQWFSQYLEQQIEQAVQHNVAKSA